MVGGSNPITILMVEDSEEDIELTLRGLERAKLQNRIWTVPDGVEALAFLRREAPYEAAPRPDLLLLDLNLPKLDGRDVLLRIREDPHLRSFLSWCSQCPRASRSVSPYAQPTAS